MFSRYKSAQSANLSLVISSTKVPSAFFVDDHRASISSPVSVTCFALGLATCTPPSVTTSRKENVALFSDDFSVAGSLFARTVEPNLNRASESVTVPVLKPCTSFTGFFKYGLKSSMFTDTVASSARLRPVFFRVKL